MKWTNLTNTMEDYRKFLEIATKDNTSHYELSNNIKFNLQVNDTETRDTIDMESKMPSSISAVAPSKSTLGNISLQISKTFSLIIYCSFIDKIEKMLESKIKVNKRIISSCR